MRTYYAERPSPVPETRQSLEIIGADRETNDFT